MMVAGVAERLHELKIGQKVCGRDYEARTRIRVNPLSTQSPSD